MNYARAVKASTVQPLQPLQSSAETELGRKLTGAEIKCLEDRFSLNTAYSCVDKVKYIKISIKDKWEPLAVWIRVHKISSIALRKI